MDGPLSASKRFVLTLEWVDWLAASFSVGCYSCGTAVVFSHSSPTRLKSTIEINPCVLPSAQVLLVLLLDFDLFDASKLTLLTFGCN